MRRGEAYRPRGPGLPGPTLPPGDPRPLPPEDRACSADPSRLSTSRGPCAEGTGLPASILHGAAGVTAAQAVSRPRAACTVSWSAGPGQAGGGGRLAAVPPCRGPRPYPAHLPGRRGCTQVVLGEAAGRTGGALGAACVPGTPGAPGGDLSPWRPGHALSCGPPPSRPPGEAKARLGAGRLRQAQCPPLALVPAPRGHSLLPPAPALPDLCRRAPRKPGPEAAGRLQDTLPWPAVPPGAGPSLGRAGCAAAPRHRHRVCLQWLQLGPQHRFGRQCAAGQTWGWPAGCSWEGPGPRDPPPRPHPTPTAPPREATAQPICK